jgi:SAM-dependent methyltransferase
VSKKKKYFFDKSGDRRMEEQNKKHWQRIGTHLAEAALEGSLPTRKWDILDIGSHGGGFLKDLSAGMGNQLIKTLSGVEPLASCRRTAQQRLPDASFFQDMEEVPDQSIDVVVSNETLYLVDDLTWWLEELRRIVRPDGGAFIALGSHAENTAWLRWRSRLKELYGHRSIIYSPIAILEWGAVAGFDMEIERLSTAVGRSPLRYSPPSDGWGEFISAEEMFKFYNEWKYLFVFYPRK